MHATPREELTAPSEAPKNYVNPEPTDSVAVPEEEWANHISPELAQSAYTQKEYQADNPEGDSLGVVNDAAFEKYNIYSSWIAEKENLPSAMTNKERVQFVDGTFSIKNADIPDDLRKNPVYMKEAYQYGTSQRMVDWITGNYYREQKNNEILDNNTGAAMATSMLAGLTSPEQWPTFIIPAGVALKVGGRLAKLSIPKAVAYEAGIAGAATTVSESLLHPTQMTRTIKESMYEVGGSVIFSGLLTGALGLAVGRKNVDKALEQLDDDMVNIDSNPQLTSVGAREADVELPKELEAQANKNIDQRIADGEVNIKDRDTALQTERKVLKETLSEVNNPKLIRAAGYMHPSVRIATSQLDSPRVVGEQLVYDQLTRGRHIYGDSLGDIAEVNMDQFKNETATKIQDVLQTQYARYSDETDKTDAKKLTYNEFAELVGKANSEGDVSDIPAVQATAKQLRSEIGQPIEDRLTDVDLLKSNYVGFDKLKREDLMDLVPEEKLDKYFNGNVAADDISKTLPKEVSDELQRIGKLDKKAKLPKGDKSFFHRSWDFSKIENKPQEFIQTLREALRGVSIEGMAKKEAVLEQRITKAREGLALRSTNPDWENAKPRPRSARLADAETKEKALKSAGDELRASRKAYDKETRDPKSVSATREKARVRMHKAQKGLVSAQRSKPISAEQKILELEDDLASRRTKHALYQEKQLDEDLTKAALEIKGAIEGGTLTQGYKLKSFESGPLKERTFAPPSNTVDEFLVKNAETVWNDYIDQITPSLHLKEKFGSIDLKEELEDIAYDYDVAILKAKTSKKAKNLTKEKKQTLRDLNAMVESLHGRYKAPPDPQAFLSKAGQMLRAFNYVTLLGMMTVSAIPDIGNIVLRHGLKSFTKGLIKVASMSKGMKLSMQQMKTMGMTADLVNNITAEKRAMLDNNYALTTRADRVMQKATSTFSKATGMTHWNAYWKQFTGFIYSNNIIEDAYKISKGTLDKKKITQYARGGLSKKDMGNIAKAMGAQETSKMDGTFIPNPEEWADQALAQRFKSALSKEVDSTIVTPSIGDMPLVSRGELGRLILQFKSFAMSANNKIILATLDDFSAQKMIGILSMVMLGGLSQIARDAAKGKETDLSSEEGIRKFMDNAIARSGALAHYGDVGGMVEKLLGGKFNPIPKFSEAPLDRYASRNTLGSILGPSAGRVEDVSKVAAAIAAGEWRESDARAMRRMAAFNNVSWMYRGFNKIEEAIGGKEYGPLGQEK